MSEKLPKSMWDSISEAAKSGLDSFKGVLNEGKKLFETLGVKYEIAKKRAKVKAEAKNKLGGLSIFFETVKELFSMKDEVESEPQTSTYYNRVTRADKEKSDISIPISTKLEKINETHPDWIQASKDAYQHFGIPLRDLPVMYGIINVESAWRPYIPCKTSKALGLGQFMPSTWQGFLNYAKAKLPQFANADRTDPIPMIYAIAWLMRENRNSYEKQLGIDIFSPNISLKEKAAYYYLAHHEGASGALSALRRNKSISNILSNGIKSVGGQFVSPKFFSKVVGSTIKYDESIQKGVVGNIN